MERAMLEQVADYFKRRLAGYPTTLSEDEFLVRPLVLFFSLPIKFFTFAYPSI